MWGLGVWQDYRAVKPDVCPSSWEEQKMLLRVLSSQSLAVMRAILAAESGAYSMATPATVHLGNAASNTISSWHYKVCPAASMADKLFIFLTKKFHFHMVVLRNKQNILKG